MSGSNHDDPAEPPANETPETPSRWWIAAITFFVGVVVGVVAVGLLSAGKQDFDRTAGDGSSPGATSAAPSGLETSGVTGSAVVNVACLRVINEAQDAYTTLTEVDQAATDVDLQQLDDIVRRLQPIERRLRTDLQDCRVKTTIDRGPSRGTPVSPSPPTATPTR